uniref:N-acetyltransferase domain-containing protein n=1 Tax=Chloropicon primus TaxID=1764295 RepID=A0A7S2SXU5_9CHLO
MTGRGGWAWALGAALEDRALEDREAPSSSKLEEVSLSPQAPIHLTPDSVKVRVARNSEELKAVAALRVSIFQQFVNAGSKEKQQGGGGNDENREAKAVRRPAESGGRGSLREGQPPTTSTRLTRHTKLPETVKSLLRRNANASAEAPMEKPDASADVKVKEQWLRRQSGLEAARIYNLGERCLCLLAVYHPRDQEERDRLLSLFAQHRNTGPHAMGSEAGEGEGRDGGSIGERLLSPFFHWHAPPVPKIPPQHQEKESSLRALEDEDGGLIVGTLNIHFDQPFRPKPKVAQGKHVPTKQQAASYLRHSNNMSVLRAVENTHGRAVSTKASMLNSLWLIKHQQRQNPALNFFQLPNEEKALQKVQRDCKQAYIFNLCVSPAFRRQGVASMLLDRAHEIATKKQIQECFLHVDFGNDAAEKLYKENGYTFEEDEEGKWNYIAGSRPRQLMRKAIRN